jgi:hypothetical protein
MAAVFRMLECTVCGVRRPGYLREGISVRFPASVDVTARSGRFCFQLILRPVCTCDFSSADVVTGAKTKLEYSRRVV